MLGSMKASGYHYQYGVHSMSVSTRRIDGREVFERLVSPTDHCVSTEGDGKGKSRKQIEVQGSRVEKSLFSSMFLQDELLHLPGPGCIFTSHP
jgi:hypothetical protein